MLLEANLKPAALVDERGCRRDIRSNGWAALSTGLAPTKTARQKKEVFFIGADPEVRNFTGGLKPQVRFGPDVFADALVPRRRAIARVRIFSKSSTCRFRPLTAFKPGAASGVALSDCWISDVLTHDASRRCCNGYRFAKRQGKSNSANPAVIQQTRCFCEAAISAVQIPFRFDSSRCLNCSSNLIGHDHPNKPRRTRWG
ncbi:hypothetical protein [uncultured Bradyrhizobium sp.]|uniref:hypothetical protein n=1 Tax=uncultured Bradyrhizobium sp. TaxID=199684 RepID=UPI0035CC4B23